MYSSVAAVEAMVVDVIDGFFTGAVKEQLFVVCMIVLHLQLFLQQLVALPQRRILDPFNLPTKSKHNRPFIPLFVLTHPHRPSAAICSFLPKRGLLFFHVVKNWLMLRAQYNH